jgi:hypothetical protein
MELRGLMDELKAAPGVQSGSLRQEQSPGTGIARDSPDFDPIENAFSKLNSQLSIFGHRYALYIASRL